MALSPAPSPGLTAALSLALALTLVVSGCALTPPGPAQAPALPSQWQAPLPSVTVGLPHGGQPAELASWWSRFDDPLLPRLVDAAQQGNGDLAQAAARIAQARANVRVSGASDWPQLTGVGNASRTRAEVGQFPGTFTQNSTSIGVDALWEIDLFGVTRNNVRAARARSDSAQAQWHDLRVSLAAEVAATYVSLRACQALVDVYTQDAGSQRRTAELTQIKAKAGLESSANASLSSASAADASNRLIGQQADCDVLIKTLVALTTLPEAELRPQLVARNAQLPQPAQFRVDAVPAQWLAQRPDVAALEREVLAAAGDVGAAQADRYPRISLAGTLSVVSASTGGSGSSVNGTNWSIGPALSLPVFDAGRRAATVDAARARYDEARARYEQRVRTAASEVEQALVRLDAALRREADAQQAALGFRQYFEAQQALVDVGAGSLLDLEQARRNALLAAAGLVNVQRERVASWITLYKSLGGGWTPDAATTVQLSDAASTDSSNRAAQ
ncbi:MAG: efflux transporter outer membrane subunit [Burkholderiales bacterium]|nr:efflux transporter outer membrane subunit [Burkholderiales bacterium]